MNRKGEPVREKKGNAGRGLATDPVSYSVKGRERKKRTWRRGKCH